MEPLKAIVMTCDRYRALTNHMIFRYEKLWPGHPFRFRIPYQVLDGPPSSSSIEYRKCPSAIKPTVLSLLDDLDGEEWVYWCIDDKYPVRLDVPGIENIHKWLADLRGPSPPSGILFSRYPRMFHGKRLTGEIIKDNLGNVYHERAAYERIWTHQFLRVKVLRHLFQSFPDEIPSAKLMDELKRGVAKPSSHRLYVSERSLAVFGESTAHGALTRNCYRSIVKCRLPLPEWFSGATEKDRVKGDFSVGQRVRALARRLAGR